MRLESSRRFRLRDIIVLQLADISDEEEPELHNLVANLSGTCQVPIIVLREGMTLSSISEADMARAGWVRMERRNDG